MLLLGWGMTGVAVCTGLYRWNQTRAATDALSVAATVVPPLSIVSAGVDNYQAYKGAIEEESSRTIALVRVKGEVEGEEVVVTEQKVEKEIIVPYWVTNVITNLVMRELLSTHDVPAASKLNALQGDGLQQLVLAQGAWDTSEEEIRALIAWLFDNLWSTDYVDQCAGAFIRLANAMGRGVVELMVEKVMERVPGSAADKKKVVIRALLSRTKEGREALRERAKAESESGWDFVLAMNGIARDGLMDEFC